MDFVFWFAPKCLNLYGKVVLPTGLVPLPLRFTTFLMKIPFVVDSISPQGGTVEQFYFKLVSSVPENYGTVQ